jgi:hypothetical protein
MKTEFLLLAQFEKPVVALEDICEEYFACKRHTAIQKAKAGTLDVNAFQLGESNKSPWMVHISDLAAMIDKRRDKAKRDWIGAIQ